MEQIILGTLNFTSPYVSSRVDPAALIRKYVELGGRDIDSATYYRNAEVFAENADVLTGVRISTKACPWKDLDFASGEHGWLSPDKTREQLEGFLKAAGMERCDTFYLHAPDRQVPIDQTLETVDALYRRELFDKFGVSNFSCADLLQVLELCEDEGWVRPVVSQNMYNMVCRSSQYLIPHLRDWGIRLVAYNPLAGGMLTGKSRAGIGRFGNYIYMSLFWDPRTAESVKAFSDPRDVSLRWLKSSILPSDGIVLGATTERQLVENVDSLVSGKPLEASELAVIDRIYAGFRVWPSPVVSAHVVAVWDEFSGHVWLFPVKTRLTGASLKSLFARGHVPEQLAVREREPGMGEQAALLCREFGVRVVVAAPGSEDHARIEASAEGLRAAVFDLLRVHSGAKGDVYPAIAWRINAHSVGELRNGFVACPMTLYTGKNADFSRLPRGAVPESHLASPGDIGTLDAWVRTRASDPAAAEWVEWKSGIMKTAETVMRQRIHRVADRRDQKYRGMREHSRVSVQLRPGEEMRVYDARGRVRRAVKQHQTEIKLPDIKVGDFVRIANYVRTGACDSWVALTVRVRTSTGYVERVPLDHSGLHQSKRRVKEEKPLAGFKSKVGKLKLRLLWSKDTYRVTHVREGDNGVLMCRVVTAEAGADGVPENSEAELLRPVDVEAEGPLEENRIVPETARADWTRWFRREALLGVESPGVQRERVSFDF